VLWQLAVTALLVLQLLLSVPSVGAEDMCCGLLTRLLFNVHSLSLTPYALLCLSASVGCALVVAVLAVVWLGVGA